MFLLAGGSNVVIADAGVDATVVLSAPGESPRRRGRRSADGRGGRAVGRPGGARVAGAGPASSASPASPARPAPPRSRTSAPTARRSPRRSPRCGCCDRAAARCATCRPAECGFAYRTSVFKRSDRYVVLAVTFALRREPLSAPVRYAELARTLGVELGERAPLADVRDGGAEAARRQGHGARPRRPRHLLASARSSPTPCSTAAASTRCATGPARRAADWPGPDGRSR